MSDDEEKKIEKRFLHLSNQIDENENTDDEDLIHNDSILNDHVHGEMEDYDMTNNFNDRIPNQKKKRLHRKIHDEWTKNETQKCYDHILMLIIVALFFFFDWKYFSSHE